MRRAKKVFLYIIGLCVSSLILAACSSLGSTQGGWGEVTGKVWNLTLLKDKELLPGSNITAQFTSDGKVGGSSGCNRYAGSYTSAGNTLQITSPLASTMMACAQELMDQETAYLTALSEVKTYSVTGDQLTLSNANNKSLLIYKAQSQNLSATSWEVIAYNNGKQAVTSVLAGSNVTAEFGTDGTLSGNSGCNTYNGTYTVTGNKITISPLASTRMACSDPAGVMEQETQFLAALQTAATYNIENATLELRTKDGALAIQALGTVPVASTHIAPTSGSSIQDIEWQWMSVTNQANGDVEMVPDPEKYTITFLTDGTFVGKADCNNISGTYAQENGFTIKVGASTMAYCGETSWDQKYLALLGSVAAGGPDGEGNLALETAGGEQRMLFLNGGPASK
jgi:heat shock protein HslJ